MATSGQEGKDRLSPACGKKTFSRSFSIRDGFLALPNDDLTAFTPKGPFSGFYCALSLSFAQTIPSGDGALPSVLERPLPREWAGPPSGAEAPPPAIPFYRSQNGCAPVFSCFRGHKKRSIFKYAAYFLGTFGVKFSKFFFHSLSTLFNPAALFSQVHRSFSSYPFPCALALPPLLHPKIRTST